MYKQRYIEWVYVQNTNTILSRKAILEEVK